MRSAVKVIRPKYKFKRKVSKCLVGGLLNGIANVEN